MKKPNRPTLGRVSSMCKSYISGTAAPVGDSKNISAEYTWGGGGREEGGVMRQSQLFNNFIPKSWREREREGGTEGGPRVWILLQLQIQHNGTSTLTPTHPLTHTHTHTHNPHTHTHTPRRNHGGQLIQLWQTGSVIVSISCHVVL